MHAGAVAASNQILRLVAARYHPAEHLVTIAVARLCCVNRKRQKQDHRVVVWVVGQLVPKQLLPHYSRGECPTVRKLADANPIRNA